MTHRLLSFPASLSIFAIGESSGWSTVAVPRLLYEKDGQHLTADQTGWAVTLMGAGSVFSLLVSEYLIDGFGRKKTIMMSLVPIALSSLMMEIDNFIVLLLARIMAGAGGTILNSVISLYVGEIAEVENRGALNFISSITFTMGILYVYSIDAYINLKTMNIAIALPIILIIIITCVIPETPYYYLLKEKGDEAEKSLQRLREKDQVAEEFELMKKYINDRKNKNTGFRELWKNPGSRKAFFIIVGLGSYQPLGGSLALRYYSIPIIEDSGFSLNGNLSIIIMCVVTLIGTIFGSFLIDSIGRRIVLFISTGLMNICLLTAGVFYALKYQNFNVSDYDWLPFLSLVVYNTIYLSATLPLSNVLMSEYFSTNIKAIACSIIVVLVSIVGTFSTKLCEMSFDHLGYSTTFFLCIINLSFGTIVMYFVMPETKGRTLMEIEEMFV